MQRAGIAVAGAAAAAAAAVVADSAPAAFAGGASASTVPASTVHAAASVIPERGKASIATPSHVCAARDSAAVAVATVFSPLLTWAFDEYGASHRDDKTATATSAAAAAAAAAADALADEEYGGLFPVLHRSFPAVFPKRSACFTRDLFRTACRIVEALAVPMRVGLRGSDHAVAADAAGALSISISSNNSGSNSSTTNSSANVPRQRRAVVLGIPPVWPQIPVSSAAAATAASNTVAGRSVAAEGGAVVSLVSALGSCDGVPGVVWVGDYSTRDVSSSSLGVRASIDDQRSSESRPSSPSSCVQTSATVSVEHAAAAASTAAPPASPVFPSTPCCTVALLAPRAPVSAASSLAASATVSGGGAGAGALAPSFYGVSPVSAVQSLPAASTSTAAAAIAHPLCLHVSHLASVVPAGQLRQHPCLAWAARVDGTVAGVHVQRHAKWLPAPR